jgi:hypothetical protein
VIASALPNPMPLEAAVCVVLIVPGSDPLLAEFSGSTHATYDGILPVRVSFATLLVSPVAACSLRVAALHL